MKKILTAVIVMVAALAISCSGGNSGSGKSDGKTKSPDKIAKLSPEDFANDVNDIYVGAFTELEKLLDKYPEINADFENEFNTVYDNAVKKMIAYGEAMSKMDQETNNNYSLKIGAKTMGDGMSKIMPIQMKLNDRFNEFSRELYTKITKLNTLLRFLDFNEMKSDHPTEAEQYGIK